MKFFTPLRFVACSPTGNQIQLLAQVAQQLNWNLTTTASMSDLHAIIGSGECLCLFACDGDKGEDAVSLLESLNVRPPLTSFLLAPHPSLSVAVRAGRAGAVRVFDHSVSMETLVADVRLGAEMEEAHVSDRKRRAELLSSIGKLVPAEHEVFRWVLSGVANKMIAKRLKVSQRTIEARRQKVFRKLSVSSLAELVRLTSLYADIESLRADLNGEDLQELHQSA